MNTSHRRLRTRSMVVLATAGLMFAAAAAAAAPAPTPPHIVISAITDDGVFIEGYDQTQGAAPVTVELLRGGTVIANAGPFAAAPAIEINHLGEPTCWNDRTPDIAYGDVVRITQGGTVEDSAVRNITVGDPVAVNATTVELHGVATEADGTTRLDVLQLAGRLINPGFQGFFGGGPFINIPAVRVGATVTANATIAFDQPANPANPAWTATIAFTGADAAAAAAVALAAEPEMGWAALDETEIVEAGVESPTGGGPAAPCTGPSAAYAVVSASPQTVAFDSTSVVLTGTARDDATQVRVSVDDANPATAAVVSGDATITDTGGGRLWTVSIPASQLDTLDNGPLTASPLVTPTPPVATLGATLTKDRGPGVLVTSGPGNGAAVNQPVSNFGFATTHPADTIVCSLDGAAFQACTSPFTTPSLADGAHTLRIRASAGTQVGAIMTRTWTVDTVAPGAGILSGPPAFTRDQGATFDLTSNEPGATFRCALDGQAAAPCGDPATFSALAARRHVLIVNAVDAAGNTSAPLAYAWTIDRTRPVLTTRIPGLATLPTARTGVLRLTGRCNERCTLVARARVVVPNATGPGATTVRVQTTPVVSRAGITTGLRLQLNAVQLRRVRTALRAGKNVRIHLTITATDRAGNATVALPGVTLRPSHLS